MDFKFLAEIIDKNWFQHIDEEHSREWTFHDDLKNMSNHELKALVSILFECLEKKADNEKEIDIAITSIKTNEYYELNDLCLDFDLLYKFLVCITLSEYRIAALLLHPPEMRDREFKDISQSIGLAEGLVEQIYLNWHSGIGEKIFSDRNK